MDQVSKLTRSATSFVSGCTRDENRVGGRVSRRQGSAFRGMQLDGEVARASRVTRDSRNRIRERACVQWGPRDTGKREGGGERRRTKKRKKKRGKERGRIGCTYVGEYSDWPVDRTVSASTDAASSSKERKKEREREARPRAQDASIFCPSTFFLPSIFFSQPPTPPRSPLGRSFPLWKNA